MIDFLLAVALVVPSNMQIECIEEKLLVERIKYMQIIGYSVGRALESLAHLGYDLAKDSPEVMRGIIEAAYGELGTPEYLGKREYIGCLKERLK